VAYDPRCTHGLCRYAWKPETSHFTCACHEGEYDISGNVVAGPPPKPLGRFPITETAEGITVSVPGDFQTPKASLPA
jgi:cytochrome b6-f complex iron-sulfur subunit